MLRVSRVKLAKHAAGLVISPPSALLSNAGKHNRFGQILARTTRLVLRRAVAHVAGYSIQPGVHSRLCPSIPPYLLIGLKDKFRHAEHGRRRVLVE